MGRLPYDWFVYKFVMMTSSNENIFSVTGPLCGEFIGHLWISLTKSSDAELWWFLWSTPEQTIEQTTEMLVIWDAIALIMTSLWYKFILVQSLHNFVPHVPLCWLNNFVYSAFENLPPMAAILIPHRPDSNGYQSRTSTIFDARHQWWEVRVKIFECWKNIDNIKSI